MCTVRDNPKLRFSRVWEGWELELLACRRSRGESSRLRLWLNGSLQVQYAAMEIRKLELEMGMDDKRKQREQLRQDGI